MYKILIVDDEKIVHLAIKAMINWSEGRFAFAGSEPNGLAAYKAVIDDPPDIIISDIKMPVMDGVELVKALRDLDFSGEILIISNYNDFKMVRSCLKYGAFDYLMKVGINAEEFNATLNRIADRLDEKRSLTGRIQAPQKHLSVSLVMDQCVRRALGGEEDGPLIERMEEAYPLPDGAGVFSFLVFSRYRSHSRFAQEYGDTVINIVSELIKKTQWISFVGLGPSAGLVSVGLSSQGVGKLNAPFFFRRLAELSEIYYSADMVSVSIGVSFSYRDFLKSAEAGREALKLCFYSEFQCEGLSASELPLSDSSPLLSENHFFKTLTGCVEDGDAAPLGRLMSELLRQAVEDRLDPMTLKRFIKRSINELIDSAPFFDADSLGLYRNERDILLAAESDRELCENLLEIIGRAVMIRSNLGRKVRRNVQAIIEYLEEHACAERVTLDGLAEHVNLDKTYICKIFKEITGKSIIGYVNEMKMNRSLELLRSGDMLVKEVASEVGINDPFYFNRLFKKHFNISPNHIRRAESPRAEK